MEIWRVAYLFERPFGQLAIFFKKNTKKPSEAFNLGEKISHRYLNLK